MNHHHANTNDRSDDLSTKGGTSMAQVLIADDDPDALELLAEVLRPLPLQVHKATSGAELVLLIADHGPFDLIVTDIDMPWMEGLGVIRSARAAKIETPVLFVSGIARPDLEASVACLSDSRLLRKPVSVSDLRRAVGEMLLAWQARRLRWLQRKAGPHVSPSRTHLS